MDALGNAYLYLGEVPHAVNLYEQLAIVHEIGDRDLREQARATEDRNELTQDSSACSSNDY